jgi:hypothetical protein
MLLLIIILLLILGILIYERITFIRTFSGGGSSSESKVVELESELDIDNTLDFFEGAKKVTERDSNEIKIEQIKKKFINDKGSHAEIFNSSFNCIYVISGLARSGNHLFISWLISGLKKMNKPIFYLNNIKGYEFSNNKALQRKLYSFGDNRSKEKLDANIYQSLATRKQYHLHCLKKLQTKPILIITFENKSKEYIDIVSQILSKFCDKLIKVMVLRDVFNFIASRIKSEEEILKILNISAEELERLKAKRKDNLSKEEFSPKIADELDKFSGPGTDRLSIYWWLNNLEAMNDKTWNIFNYNLFISEESFRKKLASDLNILYESTLLTKNKFGLTGQGTSFTQHIGTSKEENYLDRWKEYKENPLMSELLKSGKIKKIVEKEFKLKIT